MTDFARVFPAYIFLGMMGVSVEGSDEILGWYDEFMHTSPDDDPDGAIQRGAGAKIAGVLEDLMAARRAQPGDDLVSALLSAEIDGKRLTDPEVLQQTLFLLYMGALDTTKSQLAIWFHYLAQNPDKREQLASHPESLGGAVEELLRAFGITSTGRLVMRDVEWKGCPMKAGDRLLLPLMAASRDPAEFPDPAAVDFDREANRHLSFGVGPHRCIGSYLARAELRIGLEEWHARIPDYRLDPDKAAEFHAGGVVGYDKIHLIWDV